jgi:hypothetical protein
MLKIYDSGLKYKKEESSNLKDNYLLDLKSKEATNPDAKIPFVALKNIFLRPNIDEGIFIHKNLKIRKIKSNIRKISRKILEIFRYAF